MSMKYRGWVIEETPCYPCKWRIYKAGCAKSNGTCWFYRTVEEAKEAINARKEKTKGG